VTSRVRNAGVIAVAVVVFATACSGSSPKASNEADNPTITAPATQPAAPTNPAAVCAQYEQDLAPATQGFGQLVQGTIPVSDYLPTLKKAQDAIAHDASGATGAVGNALQQLSDELGRTRVALNDGGLAGDQTEREAYLNAAQQAHRACLSAS
jgi:hypothetical protein